MNTYECLKKLREIKSAAFATIDEFGNPQVRIIDIMIVENNKLYFTTARGKGFYRELKLSKKVAITAMTTNYQMIRLNGEVKHIRDREEWVSRIFLENPSMNSVYPNNSRYILEVFCVEDGEIEYFDLSDEPINRKSFKLGRGNITEKGFHITKRCVCCRKCKIACPQNCIEESNPFFIIQKNCLHCGLCFEICPVSAIRRKEVI